MDPIYEHWGSMQGNISHNYALARKRPRTSAQSMDRHMLQQSIIAI